MFIFSHNTLSVGGWAWVGVGGCILLLLLNKGCFFQPSATPPPSEPLCLFITIPTQPLPPFSQLLQYPLFLLLCELVPLAIPIPQDPQPPQFLLHAPHDLRIWLGIPAHLARYDAFTIVAFRVVTFGAGQGRRLAAPATQLPALPTLTGLLLQLWLR